MTENQKPYQKRLQDFMAIISHPGPAKDTEIQTKDEYSEARLAISHFGHNLLGGRMVRLLDGEIPLRSEEEARSGFLEGLEGIDTLQLPPEKAQEFETLRELARTGNWNDLGFVTQLNTYCRRFVRQQPICQEEDQS